MSRYRLGRPDVVLVSISCTYCWNLALSPIANVSSRGCIIEGTRVGSSSMARPNGSSSSASESASA